MNSSLSDGNTPVFDPHFAMKHGYTTCQDVKNEIKFRQRVNHFNDFLSIYHRAKVDTTST